MATKSEAAKAKFEKDFKSGKMTVNSGEVITPGKAAARLAAKLAEKAAAKKVVAKVATPKSNVKVVEATSKEARVKKNNAEYLRNQGTHGTKHYVESVTEQGVRRAKYERESGFIPEKAPIKIKENLPTKKESQAIERRGKETSARRSEENDARIAAKKKAQRLANKEHAARRDSEYTKTRAKMLELKAKMESSKPPINKGTIKVVNRVKARTAEEARIKAAKADKKWLQDKIRGGKETSAAEEARLTNNEKPLFKRLEKGFYKGKAKPE